MIPVYKPYLNKETLKYAHEALDSTWISSRGKYISEVERELSAIHTINDVNIKSALTVCNGTAACHLMAKALKHKYPKVKKIIAPNGVYAAAWNSFLFDGNYEIEIIDCDLDTWNFDLNSLYSVLEGCDLEETALLVVHNIGNIVNVPAIKRDWKDLIILEDNCEGFLGEYEGLKSGSCSFASAVSFFGNKSISSGEGGLVVVDPDCYKYIYKIRSQGQSDVRFVHDELGYNYRMTNPAAALLKGQLEALDEIKSKKREVFNQYNNLLDDVDGLHFQRRDPRTSHSGWMFGVRVEGADFTEMQNHFNKNCIDVRPMFYPVSSHKHLQHLKIHGGESVAKQLNKECVILPSYPDLKDHEIAHVVNTLKDYIREL